MTSEAISTRRHHPANRRHGTAANDGCNKLRKKTTITARPRPEINARKPIACSVSGSDALRLFELPLFWDVDKRAIARDFITLDFQLDTQYMRLRR